MKKFVLLTGVVILLAGCGTENTKMASCSNTVTANNGFTTTTTYDMEYRDDDTLKYVKITYDIVDGDYGNSVGDVDGVGTGTDGTAGANDDDTDNDAGNANDGDAVTNDGNLDSDDIVDGVVGDAIDGATSAVTDSILDISGLKDQYANQITAYSNIEGVDYQVIVDNDQEYKISYEIDMDTISDDNLTKFNITRNFTTMRTTYENQGLTCK